MHAFTYDWKRGCELFFAGNSGLTIISIYTSGCRLEGDLLNGFVTTTPLCSTLVDWFNNARKSLFDTNRQ
jgi:hypothetical protein